jgi:hypothetical protein
MFFNYSYEHLGKSGRDGKDGTVIYFLLIDNLLLF